MLLPAVLEDGCTDDDVVSGSDSPVHAIPAKLPVAEGPSLVANARQVPYSGDLRGAVSAGGPASDHECQQPAAPWQNAGALGNALPWPAAVESDVSAVVCTDTLHGVARGPLHPFRSADGGGSADGATAVRWDQHTPTEGQHACPVAPRSTGSSAAARGQVGAAESTESDFQGSISGEQSLSRTMCGGPASVLSAEPSSASEIGSSQGLLAAVSSQSSALLPLGSSGVPSPSEIQQTSVARGQTPVWGGERAAAVSAAWSSPAIPGVPLVDISCDPWQPVALPIGFRRRFATQSGRESPLRSQVPR
jgi:hypothetical protein